MTLQNEWDSVAVELPDGRCWVGNFDISLPGFAAFLMNNLKIQELGGGGKFLEATNWTSVANCSFDIVGIQNDGSLWTSEKLQPRGYDIHPSQRLSPSTKLSPFARVGTDRNWKTVIGRNRDALLLKEDGTLWTWKTDAFNRTNKWPGLRKFEMEQVGTDSDWSAIYKLSEWICLRKADGRVWSDCFNWSKNERSDAAIVPDFFCFPRAAFMDNHDWRGVAWEHSGKGFAGDFLVGVRDDGTLRMIAKSRFAPVKQDIQLGQETNWLAVASGYQTDVTALKADGSLWRWNLADDPQIHPDAATTRRRGSNSDWIAIVNDGSGFKSLAADGSLWYWIDPASQNDFMDWEKESIAPFAPLIGVSRKPQKIANIFSEAR